jgi:RNA polymerase sigma-70 factor (ECF subfamily)
MQGATNSPGNSAGNDDELTALLERHRDQLHAMVLIRMDRRLRGRMDASDVVQEGYVEAVERYPEYMRNPTMPPFLWLRFIVGQRLRLAHRQHLGVKARDAGREVTLYHGALPEATSESLAAQLLGRLTSPSQVAVRAELQVRLQEALNGMDAIDREVVALRHFEQLSNAETALVLGVQPRAASARYIRAIRRLKEILSSMQGFFD